MVPEAPLEKLEPVNERSRRQLNGPCKTSSCYIQHLTTVDLVDYTPTQPSAVQQVDFSEFFMEEARSVAKRSSLVIMNN